MWTDNGPRRGAAVAVYAFLAFTVSVLVTLLACSSSGGSKPVDGPALAATVGAGENPAQQDKPPAVATTGAETDSFFKDHTLGPAKIFGNLTVFAVYSKSQEDIGEVLSLDDALERGLAEVREIGVETPAPGATPNQAQAQVNAAAQVNKLVIENKGTLPILVLAGTIVKGGKQDRQIGQDFLVEPKKTEPVDAFCVEHGRWNAEREGASTGGKFKTVKVLAVGDVRAAGQYANNQSEVWNKVAETNKIHGKSAPSDTLLATLDDAELQKKRGALAGEIVAHLRGSPEPKDLVGMAYAVSGKVRGVRTFMSYRIFRSYMEILANTVALEAITSAPKAGAEPAPTVEAAQVIAFVNAVETGARSERDTSAGNANTYYEHAAGYASKAVLKPAASAPPAAAPAGADPATATTSAAKPKAITHDFLSR